MSPISPQQYIAEEAKVCAQNYAPLPVVLTRGKGFYVYDTQGKRYIDMMSAYSAVSFGHSHPDIIKTLKNQLTTLNVTSRAFYSDQLAPFLTSLCNLTNLDMALPMNTGAEAVETAIKAARIWGYTKKHIPENKAEIIVAKNNFHGRTTTIISFSTEEEYKKHFGPFTPGFVTVEFGNSDALKAAITPNTCAVLIEPMQGEAGIKIPPKGWLNDVNRICKKENILLLVDEIQTGMGRTGKYFAYQHEIDKPDGVIVGKALGGGVLPVSAFVATRDVMECFTPGSHGSTFGGNPLAAAVAHKAIELLQTRHLDERSAMLGDYFMRKLRKIKSPLIRDIRGKGLWIGVDIDPHYCSARDVCLKLMKLGILTKDTHKTVIRFAPPLIISKNAINDTVTALKTVLYHFEQQTGSSS